MEGRRIRKGRRKEKGVRGEEEGQDSLERKREREIKEWRCNGEIEKSVKKREREQEETEE